jgi:cobalt-zinc-cadmium efflux system outer membrane protein
MLIFDHFHPVSTKLRPWLAMSRLKNDLTALLLVAGLTALAPAFADAPIPYSGVAFASRGITLFEAFQLAEQNNIQLQATRKNIDLGQYDVKIAGLPTNPQFMTNLSAGKILTQQSNPFQFALSQDFQTGGKRRLKTDVARSQLVLTTFQLDALRWDIRSQVRQAYANLVAYQKSLDNLEIQSRLLDSLVDIANKRFNAGVAPRSEVLQAELARAHLESQENDLMAKVEQSTYSLNSLLGNTRPPYYEPVEKGVLKIHIQKTDLAPDLNFSLPSQDALYAKALLSRPDLRATAQQREVALRELALTKRQRIPNVNVQGGWLTAPEPPSRNRNQLDVWYNGPFVQLTFDLPVYHNQGLQIKRAQTVIQQAELQLRDNQRQARLDIDQSYSQLLAARKNILLYEDKLIPAARASLQITQRSYEVGKTPLANVVLTQQATQDVLSSYLDTVINYQNAWSSLERAVGVPIEKW